MDYTLRPMNSRGRSRTGTAAGAVLLLLCLAFCCPGADWPQYRGANHDGSSAERLNKGWVGAVTNPVWRVSVPNALSSVVVSGGRLFTQTRRIVNGADSEVCLALSITNGAELWARAVDNASYPDSGVGTDDGPRTTPAVSGGSVFVLSSYLKLYRLNATNGAVLWQKDLRTLYGGQVIAWQNAASPLVDGDLIYLNGNGGSARLMALHTSDGRLVWRAENEALTHSTPILASIQGVRQVIFATQSGLLALDPATGARLWRFSYPFSYGFSIGVSPVVCGDRVFVCGAHSYGMGSVAVQISLVGNTWTTQQAWSTNNPASHWMTPVCHQGFLYGQFGIQSFDGTRAQLKCVDIATGAVKWSTNDFGRGGTILVDEHLLTVTEKGELVLIKPNTNAYTEVARFLAIPNYHGTTNKCWNVAAVADGRVYVRSTAAVAAFDFSVPDLSLDPPQPLADGKLRLLARAVNGAAISSNRLAGLEARMGTNIAQPALQWAKLTNSLVLSNGVLSIDNVDRGGEPKQFFILREP